jgi:hypothetical protein
MAAVAEVVVRDVRANRMDTDTRMVHERLEQWGRWAKDSEARAWPESTMLARVIEQGANGASQQGKPPVQIPEAVAIVDSAVSRLGAIDRGVIQTYYLRWEPIEVMANRHKMRVRQFQNVLRRARWRILGYIDAAETKRA